MNKEQDKYYTPELTDLFVGYECEYTYLGRVNGYEKIEISLPDLVDLVNDKSLITDYRTPYLTIEQVSNEKLPDWLLIEFYSLSLLEIIESSSSEYYRYSGPCPSINEFRKIVNLIANERRN